MATSNASAPVIPAVSSSDLLNQARLLIAQAQLWIEGHWLQILIASAIGTGIALALFWLRGRGDWLARRSTSGYGWPAVFGKAIGRTHSSFIILLTARIVSGVAQPPQSVTEVIVFLFTISVVFQAAIWTREIILGAIEHRTRSEHYAGEALISAMGLIRVFVTFAVFAVALIVVLDNLGVNVTGLVAGLGVGGIAIGLAAQGIFADLFAALAIIFDRPFRRGDSVSYDNTSASVEAIGLKSTRLRSFTGEERIISNKNLLDKEISNNTRLEKRRAKFIIGVIYQTSPEECASIPAMLREITEAAEHVFVRAGFTGFGASSLDFQFEFDVMSADYATFFDARSAIGIEVLRRFNAAGLEIAYPTQTTFTSAPDGTMIMPYPQVQPVQVADAGGTAPRALASAPQSE